MKRFFNFILQLDLYLLGTSVLLVLVGLLMIYSTTLTEASGTNLFARQSVFFAIGIALLLFFSSLDYRYFHKIALAIYISGVAMLISVLLFGVEVSGSMRWFDLGFFRFQPVEFMKIGLIIYLAAFFRKHLVVMSRFRYIIYSLMFVAVPVVLTLMQPDLGSAIVLGIIWLGMLLAAGVRKIHLVWLLLFFIIIASVGWIYVLEDYQKDRFTSFIDPAADPQGRGYNALQALIAVGSGGLTGRGFARGVVSQLQFLPERQTDFIFASLAEELGFLGTSFLLAMLAFWLLRQLKITREARDNYGLLVAVGIFTYFFAQTGINIAMNIGLLPITGVPLPLISYGGSSLLTSLVSIGILQSIASRASPVRFT